MRKKIEELIAIVEDKKFWANIDCNFAMELYYAGKIQAYNEILSLLLEERK